MERGQAPRTLIIARLCVAFVFLLSLGAEAHRNLKQATADATSTSPGSVITEALQNVLSNNLTVGKQSILWAPSNVLH